MKKEFPERSAAQHEDAPGMKDSIIGFFCGLVAVVLTFSAVLPMYLNYTDGFRNNGGVLTYVGSELPSPIAAILFSLITVVIAISGLVYSVDGGAENARAGFPRGRMAIAALILSVLALIVSCIGCTCIGCTAIVSNGGVPA